METLFFFFYPPIILVKIRPIQYGNSSSTLRQTSSKSVEVKIRPIQYGNLTSQLIGSDQYLHR